VVKTGDRGDITRLADIGRVELGAKNYDVGSYLDGEASVTMAIFQLPGANALATAEAVRAGDGRLKARFPEGMDYKIVYDTTVFVDESIHEVYKTLFEAFVLVFIVVLIFLQDWRATLLPMIDVPVSLIGTFFVMAMLGFSLNNLSLLGLVLAIGIVVDDAIVVVENVERWMAKGLPPREATIKALEEITGPVIAITLVLSSVFIPTAFIAGISGQFYRQFALTIAASTIISAINAMTMAPARAVTLIKPHKPARSATRRCRESGVVMLFALLFDFFLTRRCSGSSAVRGRARPRGARQPGGPLGRPPRRHRRRRRVGWLANHAVNRVLLRFFKAFKRLLRSPDDRVRQHRRAAREGDRDHARPLRRVHGLHVRRLQPRARRLHPGAGQGLPRRERDAARRREPRAHRGADDADREDGPATPGVAHTISIPGYSILTSNNISNAGGMFVILKPFEDRIHDHLPRGSRRHDAARQFRHDPGGRGRRVRRARRSTASATRAASRCRCRTAPTRGRKRSRARSRRSSPPATRSPGSSGSSARSARAAAALPRRRPREGEGARRVAERRVRDAPDLPRLVVRERLHALRPQLAGERAGRRGYRVDPSDIGTLKVRNREGRDGAALDARHRQGHDRARDREPLQHVPVGEVAGGTAPGVSSARRSRSWSRSGKSELPPTDELRVDELTLQQILAGNTAVFVFILGAILVFMVLAAQYESWSLPGAIILIVPMCLSPRSSASGSSAPTTTSSRRSASSC
jgi:multidrug efflux pump